MVYSLRDAWPSALCSARFTLCLEIICHANGNAAINEKSLLQFYEELQKAYGI